MELFFLANALFVIIILLIALFCIRKCTVTMYKKGKSKILQLNSYAVLWNFFFCPHKVQNIRDLAATYLVQVLMGGCILSLKEKIVTISWGSYNYILFYHPDTAQEVLKSYTVINKDWMYNIFHPWLGTGLLTSSDNKWRNRRKLLTPAFHFRILEDFQGIFNTQSDILIEILKNKKVGEVFDITEVVSRCTLDVIGDSAMGVHIDAQGRSDNAYVLAVVKITSSTIDWFTKPWYWIPLIFNTSSVGKRYRSNISVVHQFDRKVIREKKQKLIEEIEESQYIDDFQQDTESIGRKKRRAFLDLLLYHHLTDGSLTEEDVREEVDTFMFEGHDTTSMGVSWTLYLLGLHHDIQERVFRELESIFGDDFSREITTEDLKKMKYLELVIKESNRIYPPVPIILRKNLAEFKVGEYTIPAKSSLAICIHSMHHNPTVFDNPEVFDPDRFLPENCERRHPFAFIPFSAGPRNCIGQRFAMMEMKTVLANILRHFKVHSLDHRDKICEAADVILRPKYGIRMTVMERKVGNFN